MDNDYEILAAFLERFEPEVSGRSSEPVSEEDASLITRFAAGKLGTPERSRLTSLLASNDQALHMLVDALHGEG